MGTVYRARDLVLEETVAIKVLRPEYAADPKMAQRFKSEIRLARKVRHKNVCSIHDFGEYRGFLYISMEFIKGIDLKRILKEKGAPPFHEAYELAIQVANGLRAVHDTGIIHRDLKASNIMRDEDGVVRLMDFGVAKQYGAGGTITSTGQVVGTPEYMSPEQAQGHKLDFRSDVYALGVLIYELFTGRVPFRGDTPISTILKHIHEPPPLYGPPSSRIPAPLVPILRKALSKNPNERQSSVRDVIEELKKAAREPYHPQSMPTAMQEGTTLLAATPASVPAVEVPRGRRIPRPWLFALAAVFVVAGGVWVYRSLAPPPENDQVDTADDASVYPPVSTSLPGGEEPSGQETASMAATSTSRPEAVPTTSVATSTVPATTRPTTSIRAPRTTSTARPVTTSVASTSVSTTTTTTTPPTTTVLAGEGWLQVAVIPWGTVQVDGQPIGTTPLDRISLSAGSHTVRLRHPDYEPIEKTITVQPEETTKLVVNLRREGKRIKD
jgi:serine/threonine-protein kinase